MKKTYLTIFLILWGSIMMMGSTALADNLITTSQQPFVTTRLSGETKYETAKAISEYYKNGKIQHVILSTGNGFADALSASVLAHQKEAPILLVDTSVEESKDAYDYITQHLDLTGTIYIIGGTGIISKEFDKKLNSLGFINIVRIAGIDRYKTSYQLALSLSNTSLSTVVISSGESYPDALSIASFAANRGWPILLTPQDALPQEMKDFLLEKKPSQVYITGGIGAISDNVKSDISGLLPHASVERLSGQSRFDSNATIAQTFATNPSTIYIATGYEFADALAGSALAAEKGDPIIFIDPSVPTLPKSVASYFGKLNASKQSPKLIAFGENGIVSNEVLKCSNELISGTVKEDSIYSIADITVSVPLNQTYSLPATAKALLYNSDTCEAPVKWNPSTVDTSNVGSSVYDGAIDGYGKTIRLTVTVTNLITNIPFINAVNHIITPTYDYSGQAVHPSVIDFKTEYNIEAWGYFRYWMALTPYPNSNSAFENPSILASKDGLNWINPPGLKNPLASRPLGSLHDNYNSDPELVYDPNLNILILYWRECNENVFEKIWAVKISSDYKQSDKIICLEKPWDYKKTGLILSPTIWRKSGKEWYMWTTDSRSAMQLHTSIDGMTWSSGQPCSAPWDKWNGGYIPWHIEAKPNYREKRIDFVIAGWPITGTMKDCQLLYATAPMPQPQELSMPLLGSLLRASSGDQWDNGYIYRSSFVLEPGDSPKFRIWYSACSKKNAWYIGYTEGTLANIPSNTQHEVAP